MNENFADQQTFSAAVTDADFCGASFNFFY